MHQNRFLELDNQLRTPKWMAASNELGDTAYTAIARKPIIKITLEVIPRSERSTTTSI